MSRLPGQHGRMPSPPPPDIPAEARAGDTVQWTRSLPQYLPADGWSLGYVLVTPASAHAIATTAVGDEHQALEAAAASAAWPAGRATLVEQVTRGSERHTLGEYFFRVLPNLIAGTGADTRTHAQRVLDNLNAWLEGKADFAGEIELAGRRIKTYSLEELLMLRDRYAAMAANEAAGTGAVRRMVVRL